MEILIAATKTDHLRPLMEKELQDAGLEYEVKYFSEHPEITEKYNIKTSPLLIVDGEVFSIGLPKHGRLKDLKKKLEAGEDTYKNG